MFNIMQTFPAIFFIIADFGLNAIATRELSKNWDNASSLLGSIAVLRIAISALLMIFAFIVLQIFPYSGQLKFGIYLSLFLILTQALFATINIVFQVKLRYDLSTVGLVLGSLAVLILSLAFSYLKMPVVWVSFSYVLGGIVTFFVNFYFMRKLNVRVALNFDKNLWKFLILQSWPIGLAFIFSQVNFKADTLLLSIMNLPQRYGFGNTESVAIYGLPYRVFEVSLVVPTFFMNAIYPVFVQKMGVGKDALRSIVVKSTTALGICGVLLGFLGIIFADTIINILGGSEFLRSGDVVKLLFFGLFIFYITQPLSWLIVTLDKQVYLPAIYLAAAVFNLAGNILFIPVYSFYASSVLTWLSEGLILVLLIIAARRAWKAKYA